MAQRMPGPLAVPMKRIERYTPPSAKALARLKTELNFTSPQMADLAGLAQGAQWRKYTGGQEPRALGMQMHFYMAALLTLSEAELMRVVDTMREQGAALELGPLPAGSSGLGLNAKPSTFKGEINDYENRQTCNKRS